MILFDVTHGWQGTGTTSDKPRTATDTERNAYVRWLAESRGIDISGCTIDAAGAYRGSGKDAVYVLAMPGYGDTRRATMETLDEAGNVIRTTTIATDAKGYMVLKAKQVQEASGLKPVRKSNGAKKPVERAQPEATVVAVAAEIASPAPVPAAQPVQSVPAVDSDLVARVAALEATLARVGIAVLMAVPIAANDDAPAAKRSAAHERAIRRAWEIRAEKRRYGSIADDHMRMRELAQAECKRLARDVWTATKRAEEAETGRDFLVIRSDEMRDRAMAAEAKAADFERIAIAEATRADEAEAERAVLAEAARDALANLGAAARRGDEQSALAAHWRKESDRMERVALQSDERAHNAESRAMRMVRAASGYRTRFQRERQDARAARAEARAIGRRLEALRNPAPAPAAIPTAMASALAAALN